MAWGYGGSIVVFCFYRSGSGAHAAEVVDWLAEDGEYIHWRVCLVRTAWDILELGDGKFIVDPAVLRVEAVGLAVSCWDLAVGRTGNVLEEAAASGLV